MMLEMHCDVPFTEECEKLDILLSQGQFELLEWEGLKKEHKDLRLVYLMNDTAESFLVFRHARLTGQYDQEYEGELTARLSRYEEGYVLIVHQGESVVSVFFEDLILEVYLFSYGQTGHFWVERYEYLRQLEFRLAILRDKRVYLGERYCNDLEIRLSELTGFPPLNYCCYPAVPAKYLVFSEGGWALTEEAWNVMLQLTEEAGDRKMKRTLSFYKKHPGKLTARLIAWKLHRKKHSRVVDLLNLRLREAAGEYPERRFSEEEEAYNRKILDRAEKRREELVKQGLEAELLREEPFVYAKDSIEFKAHLMVYLPSGRDRKVRVETITGKDL